MSDKNSENGEDEEAYTDRGKVGRHLDNYEDQIEELENKKKSLNWLDEELINLKEKDGYEVQPRVPQARRSLNVRIRGIQNPDHNFVKNIYKLKWTDDVELNYVGDDEWILSFKFKL